MLLNLVVADAKIYSRDGYEVPGELRIHNGGCLWVLLAAVGSHCVAGQQAEGSAMALNISFYFSRAAPT